MDARLAHSQEGATEIRGAVGTQKQTACLAEELIRAGDLDSFCRLHLLIDARRALHDGRPGALPETADNLVLSEPQSNDGALGRH